jgi:hypothetical protein
MAVVAGEIQWQPQCLDQAVLKFPGLIVEHPGDKCIPRHPIVEFLLPVVECSAVAAPNTPEFEPKLPGQQAPKRQPEG